MTLLKNIRVLAGDNDVQPFLTDAELQETLELLVVYVEDGQRKINLLDGALEYLRQLEAFRPDSNPKRVQAAQARYAYLDKIGQEKRDELTVDYDLEAVVVIPGGGGQGPSVPVSQASVYEVLKDILVEGTGVTLVTDDVEDEITITSKDQTARDSAAAAQGAADSAATAAGNANSAAAKVAQDLVAETTARTSADSALDARVKTLEDGSGAGVGIESILLPAKASGGADRRATVTVTWTLAEIRTVEAEFAEPEGDYILAATLSDQSEFTVEHVEWDDTNSELDVVLRNVNGGTRADTYTGRVTLNVLRGAEGGGGTGDVTTAQLEAEATARQDGDDVQSEGVSDGTAFLQVLRDQKVSANPAVVRIDAPLRESFEGVDHTYKTGDVVYYSPKSVVGKTLFNRYDGATHVSDTASTESEWNTKVTAQGSKHTHLWLRVTKRLFSTIGTNRRARELGELYHLPPYSSVAAFIVDTSSAAEVEAIINAAFSNGVALWARGPGQNVDEQNNRAYPLPGDLAPTPQKDYALFNDGNRNEWRAVPSGGVPADGSISTAKIAARAVTGDKVAVNTIENINLTKELQVQQVELLIDPDREALTGKYDITVVNAAAVSGGFVQVELNGRVVGGRVAWTQQTTFSVTPTTADITAMSLVSTTRVNVALGFYSHASAGQGDFYGSPQTFTYVRPKSTGGGGRTATLVFDNDMTNPVGNITPAADIRPVQSSRFDFGNFALSDLKENEVIQVIVRFDLLTSSNWPGGNWDQLGCSMSLGSGGTTQDNNDGEFTSHFAEVVFLSIRNSSHPQYQSREASEFNYFRHASSGTVTFYPTWRSRNQIIDPLTNFDIRTRLRCRVWVVRG